MAKAKAQSNSERQKKFTAKLKSNPEKFEKYLAEERERWKKRKEANKIKSVDNMSAREVRNKRKEWKVTKRLQRQKQKDVIQQQTEYRNNNPSPPATPAPVAVDATEHGQLREMCGSCMLSWR